jgi:hypothetical protein
VNSQKKKKKTVITISSLPPLYADLTYTTQGFSSSVTLPAQHKLFPNAPTISAEAQKLKTSICLKYNFLLLLIDFNSVNQSGQYILPDNHKVVYKIGIQKAIEVFLNAYYCNVSFT